MGSLEIPASWRSTGEPASSEPGVTAPPPTEADPDELPAITAGDPTVPPLPSFALLPPELAKLVSVPPSCGSRTHTPPEHWYGEGQWPLGEHLRPPWISRSRQPALPSQEEARLAIATS